MTLLFLLLAIVFEVGWAIAMKVSAGFTKPIPTAATILMYLLSVIFLALATRRLEIGTAYAVWAGSGVALIALIGIVHFREPLTAARIISIMLILAGIVGLHLSGGGQPIGQPG